MLRPVLGWGAGGRSEMLIGLWRGRWQVGSHATEEMCAWCREARVLRESRKGLPTPENGVLRASLQWGGRGGESKTWAMVRGEDRFHQD